jgi:hypothetical protein
MVLGAILPISFSAGILARKPVPSLGALPPVLANSFPSFKAVEWERAGLFTNAPVTIRCLREEKDSGGVAIQFEAPKDFLKPDWIVYWVAGNPDPAGRLPVTAILLGSLSPGITLSLPEDAGSTSGVLVLYSLIEQEMIAVSRPLPHL